jgi:hypothetical protein
MCSTSATASASSRTSSGQTEVPATRGAPDTASRGTPMTIEIARPHATFEIVSIEAVKATEDGRPVWRVTMQGAPASPGSPLRPTVIVYVHRQSGEVISIAKS